MIVGNFRILCSSRRLLCAPSLRLRRLQCASVLSCEMRAAHRRDGDPSGSELAGSDWLQASCGRIHALDPFATATSMTLTVCQTLRRCAQMRSAVCRSQSRAALSGPRSVAELRSHDRACCSLSPCSLLILRPPAHTAPVRPHCANSGTNVAHAAAAHSRCATAGRAQQCEWRAAPIAAAAPRSVRANCRPRCSSVRLQIRVHRRRCRCG